MRITREQMISGVLVVATVVPFVGYALDADVPFIEDARGMGFTGLVLGAVAWFVLGAKAFGAKWLGVGGAVVAVALGVTAAVLETGTASTVFLGAFVAVMVAMWLTAVVHQTGVLHDRGTHRGAMPHAT
jgi:hypothetical protein